MVTAKKCFDYDIGKIKNIIQNIFESHKFIGKLESLDSVLLKPNLLGNQQHIRS